MEELSIRTPDQRLRVFVSSTLAELADERGAVHEAIERLQLTPVMFELGARPHPPRNLYRAYLEQSHIFVGIYWQRYGWVAPGETVSGLEDEYLMSNGMPRLLYVKAPAEEREPRFGHLHLLRGENEEAARALQENRSLPEQLHDHHQLAHADQALALLAISSHRDAEGETLFQDVSRRLREMGLTMMGGTYALGLADLYRRGGRPSLAGALLRHAMSLVNPTIQSAEYARAKQQMAALAEVGEENSMIATQEARSTDGDLQMSSFDVLQPEPEVIR